MQHRTAQAADEFAAMSRRTLIKGLAAGECAASAVESQIAESNVNHKFQAGLYLLQYLGGNQRFFLVQFQPIEKFLCVFDTR